MRLSPRPVALAPASWKTEGEGEAFRPLTECIDTPTPHGEFLFNLFGTLAQYERSLIRERGQRGARGAPARMQGRAGTDDRQGAVDQVAAALNGGSSQSAVCRRFEITRSTLTDTLERIGWSGAGEKAEAETPMVAARERAGRALSGFDGLIAAIARVRDAAIATHNVGDFANCGVPIVNPWDEPGIGAP